MIWKRSFSGKAWRHILIGAAVGAVFMVLAVWAIMFFTARERLGVPWAAIPFGLMVGAVWTLARLQARSTFAEVATKTGYEYTTSLGWHCAIEWREAEMLSPGASAFAVAATDARGRMRSFNVRWSLLEEAGVSDDVRAVLDARFGAERIASHFRDWSERSRRELRDRRQRVLIGGVAVAIVSVLMLCVGPFVLPKEIPVGLVLLGFLFVFLFAPLAVVAAVRGERENWLRRHKRWEQLGWLLPLTRVPASQDRRAL